MGMAVMVPQYSVHDLAQFPDDGNRYELLDGTLLVTPAPGVPHQSIAAQLTIALGSALQVPTQALIFAPGVVVRAPRTQLEPDILVVPARFPLQSRWADINEYWLAVEIMSRSSRVYDREFKRDAYLALGVREVWLIDTANRVIEMSREPGVGTAVRNSINWEVPEVGVRVRIDVQALLESKDQMAD